MESFYNFSCFFYFADEVDIRLEVCDVMQEAQQLGQRLEERQQSADRNCECARVEKEILDTAKEMFR